MLGSFSLQDRERIFAELRELREGLRLVNQRVDRLADLVEDRVAYDARSSLGSATIVSSVPYTREFEVIAPEGVLEEPPVPVELPSEREGICRTIGEWLQRAVRGEHRGNSGRHRLPEGSTLYIVCRDFAGKTYLDPIKVCYRFSEVRSLCSSKGDWGNSIFLGLPSALEVRAVVRAAGFSCPPLN